MRRYILPQKNPRKTLILVVVAVCLMIVFKGGLFDVRESANFSTTAEALGEMRRDGSLFEEMDRAEKISDDVFMFSHVSKDPPADVALKTDVNVGPQEVLPTWQDFAAKAPVSKGKVKIAIVIDDLGMDQKRTQKVIDVNGPLTLAFLPYAPNLKSVTSQARKKGHELMIHVPMEPVSDTAKPGPDALLSSMSIDEIGETLDAIFESFEGYVGINNHMGSKLTQNSVAMEIIMDKLAQRGLLFLDSKTIASSVAGDIAAARGLDYAERDVFLDHQNTEEFVRMSLKKLENVAFRNGSAIAIGHPKDVTIKALNEWLPTLEGRGIAVVPISSLVKRQEIRNVQSQP